MQNPRNQHYIGTSDDASIRLDTERNMKRTIRVGENPGSLDTLRSLAKENIERVEWTLQDKEWRPTRAYVEKLLAAYKELAKAHVPEPQRAFFTGPLWLIELVWQVYGDSIDYVEQKPIPEVDHG